MTTYTYNGPGELYYPDLALTVNPGDTADLAANPGDGWWTPADPPPAAPTAPPTPAEVADPPPPPDDPNPVPIPPQTKTATSGSAKGATTDAQAV